MVKVPLGIKGTEATIELAVKTAKERGIKHLVVATNTGYTVDMLKDCGLHVTVVSHVWGMKTPGVNELSDENRAKYESWGFKVCTAAHALSAGERGLSTPMGGVYPLEIMAHTLRMFSQGVKVCVECSTMAMDGGYIPYGEEIVAIGGTGRGADTCCLLYPSYSHSILKTSITEVVCMPEKPVKKDKSGN